MRDVPGRIILELLIELSFRRYPLNEMNSARFPRGEDDDEDAEPMPTVSVDSDYYQQADKERDRRATTIGTSNGNTITTG